MNIVPRWPLLFLSACLLAAVPATQEASPTGKFEVRFDESAFSEPYTGPVFVAFAELQEQREPRQTMHGWFNAPPVLRFDVEDIAPGATISLIPGQATAKAPMDWTGVEAKAWKVQAVVRLSRTGRQAGLDAGDIFGEAREVLYDSASEESLMLPLDTVVEPEIYAETENTRYFEFTSPALSKFHGFDYVMRAGIRLPKNYGEADTYPVVYIVTGFGGTHESIQSWSGRIVPDSMMDQCIVVVPDATNTYGHSVFCDSRSIGPWGEALVRELIPALEAEYGGAGPEHRYTTGVSSGGWSSLWLQVAYPDAFAGCWSHVPDPIDFYDFQQINLYEPLPDGSPRNMYVDEAGQARPLARRGDQVLLTYEDFVRRENVLNPGGQIRSFEATFSSTLPDGTPRRVFDVETGEIDHEAAQEWRPYDISHLLLSGWDELRDSLSGKIHVYAGEVDTFYLEGAVERFQALASEAGLLDEMVVEVIPGMAHSLHQPGYLDMELTINERWEALHVDE